MRKIAAILVFFLVPFLGFSASEPGVRYVPFDSLSNDSRLTNEELRYYYERKLDGKIAELIDLDNDAIVDFMQIEVWEFIIRMKIILASERPFEYRKDPLLNRISNRSVQNEMGRAQGIWAPWHK